MKTKYYFLAALASLTFASCADDSFIGDNSPTTQEVAETGAINFGFNMPNMTRAQAVGYEAADLLGGKFVVEGTKGSNAASAIASTVVFDNYDVTWAANTAGKTESNTADWEYVGLTKNGASSIKTTQSIKYWDYSAPQYNFVAYSVGKGNTALYTDPSPTPLGANELLLSAINPATGTYTVKGGFDALKKFFIADMVTKNHSNGDYNSEVEIAFRHLNSKIRIGLYETVPGYSVKDVKFYSSASGNSYDTPTPTNPTTTPTLYSSASTIFSAGTYTVTYPTVGTSNTSASDYNKAHVAISGQTGGTTQTFAALDYNNSKSIEGTPLAAANYLGEASNAATYPTSSSTKDYTDVLPNEVEGVALTLRVDYTLVSNDGSKENITVRNASAVVPAIYCQWKPGYAYTYLFKISDKSNGITGLLDSDPKGLYPITFDAVVLATEDFVQETVSTIATTSITTYQHNPASNAVIMDEYKSAAGPIYVIVDGKSDLNVNGQLYTVTTSGTTISEATVIDALNIEPVTVGSVTTGRNGVELTAVASDATITNIVGPDGNNIAVSPANSAASFTPASAATYAYVYKLTGGKQVTLSAGADMTEYYTDPMCTTSGTGTATGGETVYQASGNITTAVEVAATTVNNPAGYYTDKECTVDATLTAGYLAAGTYYKKVTVNYATYAVKVIKVV